MRLITARGIGEPMGTNMLSQIVRALPQWEHVELPWSAQYGPVGADPLGPSFGQALAAGNAMLRRALDDGPAVVVGYSGGAALAGNVAAEGHRNLVAVGLVADPLRPGTGDHGIAGSRPVTQRVPVWWSSNPRDVICSCPPDSPLRTLADQSAAMSLGDPLAWTDDLVDRLMTNRWQAIRATWWDPISVYRRYARAIDDAQSYLGAGRINQHTVYNWRRDSRGDTYLQALAKQLREVVR